MLTFLYLTAIFMLILSMLFYNSWKNKWSVISASLFVIIMVWINVSLFTTSYKTISVNIYTEVSGDKSTQYAYWGDGDTEKINITKETGCFYSGRPMAEIKIRNHWSAGIYTFKDEILLSRVIARK